MTAAFRGSPPPLATLHRRANELIGGGPTAFAAEIHNLRGFPVVVNEWESWCPPCQAEFPLFQRAAVRYGRRVAFLGIDAQDTGEAASAWLRRFPVTYPSYTDHSMAIGRSLNAAGLYPQTLYYNATGRLVFQHGGSYADLADLDRDLRRYALS